MRHLLILLSEDKTISDWRRFGVYYETRCSDVSVMISAVGNLWTLCAVEMRPNLYIQIVTLTVSKWHILSKIKTCNSLLSVWLSQKHSQSEWVGKRVNERERGVCVCVCLNAQVHVCLHASVCVRVCVCVCVCVCACVCLHKCMHVCMYACVCVCNVCVCVYVCVCAMCVCLCMCVWMHVCMRACVYAYPCMYVCMCVHACACMCVLCYCKALCTPTWCGRRVTQKSPFFVFLLPSLL